MSNYIIASEENMEHIEHYGILGMKWLRRTYRTIHPTKAAKITAKKGFSQYKKTKNFSKHYNKIKTALEIARKGYALTPPYKKQLQKEIKKFLSNVKKISEGDKKHE